MRLGHGAAQPGRGGELVDHVGAIDERRNPVLQQEAVIGVLPAQGDDGRGDSHVAQRETFLDQRDAQPIRAPLQERLSRDGRAVAVSVRLDHRHHPAARRRSPRLPQVVHQRVRVDARLGRPDPQIVGPARRFAVREDGWLGHLGCLRNRLYPSPPARQWKFRLAFRAALL